MDKATHGRLFRAAIKGRYSRDDIAVYIDRKPRTITNWTNGSSQPNEAEKAKLRELLGKYDAEGDPVEVAIRASDLAPFRQSRVIATYQEQVHEQSREAAG